MKKFNTLAALVIFVTTFTGVANAEAHFDSYISNAGTGFTSRTWVDYGLDDHPTTIRFDECHYRAFPNNFPNLSVQLTIERTFTPDINRGIKVYDNCRYSQGRSWGVEPADTYHFTIVGISGLYGNTNIDVNFLRVKY